MPVDHFHTIKGTGRAYGWGDFCNLRCYIVRHKPELRLTADDHTPQLIVQHEEINIIPKNTELEENDYRSVKSRTV